MHEDIDQPRWLPRLSAWVQGLGPRWSLLLLCAAVLPLAPLLAQALIWLLAPETDADTQLLIHTIAGLALLGALATTQDSAGGSGGRCGSPYSRRQAV